jgi:hypothetical protein
MNRGDEWVKDGFEEFEPPPENEEPNKPGNSGQHTRQPLIQSSEEFVAGFVPPEYLIDGLIQRRFIYSTTALTGSGKTSVALRISAHVALGLKLGNRDVEQGKVLYLAGENPDDVRMRWIKLCEEMGVEPKDLPVFFLPSSPKLSDKAIRKQIDEESAIHGPFVLVIVDTSIAYFEGDDENNNVQAAAHARMLRGLAKLPDGPTIIVTCHPTKKADNDDLVPRGGGAFLNEVDTNLVCIKDPVTSIVQLHWRAKIRGVDFAPILFELLAKQSEQLKDRKGRLIWTVIARPITDEEEATREEQTKMNEERVLVRMCKEPDLSMIKIAERLGWLYANGHPNKSRVERIIRKLATAKLAKKTRDGWELTKEGEKAAQESPAWQAEENM